MPKYQVGQHTTSNNGQGIPAPQISPPSENPEQYWVLHWEGESLSQVPYDSKITTTLNDLQNLTNRTIKNALSIEDDGHIQHWTRSEMVFNEHKVRGEESSNILKVIKNIIDSELEKISKEALPIEALTLAIKDMQAAFLAISKKELSIEDVVYNIVPADKEDLINALSKFNAQESTNLINSFFDKLQNEIKTYKEPSSVLDKFNRSKQNSSSPKKELPRIQIILNHSDDIIKNATNSCLVEFFNQEIATSKITDTQALKESLPIFLQQNGILYTAHNILEKIFGKNKTEKHSPGNVDYNTAQFIFKRQGNNISGTITIPTHSLSCNGETIQVPVNSTILKKSKGNKNCLKILNNENKIERLLIGEKFDKSQYKPLFITKINVLLSPTDDGAGAKLNIQSYEILSANNSELNAICAEVSLKPIKFADLVTQLNSINGYDGKAIVEFIHNWNAYYKFSLPKNASLRTNKATVDSQDVIETLEAIIKFHFKNNKKQQYAFCKKLQMVIADKNDTAMEKMLNNVSGLSIHEKERDDYKVELFKNNLEIRKGKLRDISSILSSIKKNLNIKDAYKWKDSIPQLAHDFISLGLIADKMTPRERTTFFQDLLLSDQYNRESLTAWKQSLKQIESSKQGTLDKEIFDYLNSGVEYFESLMPIANTANKDFNRDYQIKVKEGIRNLTPTNMSNDDLAKVKAKMVTHHLNNQITCTPQIKGTKFNTKLNEFENTLSTEAVNEFKQGKTLKQVAHGEIGQLSDTNITLINNVTSNKSFPEKEQSCRAYQRDASRITAKPILRTAAAVVAGAAVGFLAGAAIFTLVVAASGGIGVIPAIFASIWFGAKTAAAATAVAATFTGLGTVSGAAAGSLAANPSSFFAVKNIKNFFKFHKHTDEVANSAAVQFNPSPSPANN